MGGDKAESWLIPSDTDRQRMLDMDRRITPVRRATFGVLAVALVITGPWIGWEFLFLLAGAAVLYRVADMQTARSERPEYWIFGAWVGSQLMIAIAAILSAPETPGLAWLALPIVTLSARFSVRGIVAGVAITLAMLVAVAFGIDTEGVIDYPPTFVMPAALVIGVAMLSTVLMRSEMHFRRASVVDPLTGLLNRKALENRVEELQHQSEVTSAPIGVVFADLDHFKEINDSVGHAAGDDVLRQIADIIRYHMRAFELAYRIGGEEFLILLPGADLVQSTALAERIRQAVAECEFPGEVRVTMSCGVSVSLPGEKLDFEQVRTAADEALYRAKRDGRDRVHVEAVRAVA